jgi:hypothetical protein
MQHVQSAGLVDALRRQCAEDAGISAGTGASHDLAGDTGNPAEQSKVSPSMLTTG